MSRGCAFPEHHQSSGGGSGLAVLVLLAVLAVAAVARPVVQAVSELVTIAVIAVIVLGCVAGLAVVAGLAWAAVRLRRRAVRRAALGYRQATAVAWRPQPREVQRRAPVAELPAPRGDVSPHLRSHSDAHVVTSRAPRPRCTRNAGRRS